MKKSMTESQGSGIFSQDSAFLQQYQADIARKNVTPTKISLLTGQSYSSSDDGKGLHIVTSSPSNRVQATGVVPMTSLIRTSQVQQKLASSAQSTSMPLQIKGGQVLQPPTSSQLVAQSPAAIRYSGKNLKGKVLASKQALLSNPYYRKWKRFKKVIKDLIFVNAAVCDEVVRIEEKVARAKEERRFLLRKLLHYRSAQEGSPLKMASGLGKLGMASPSESGDLMKMKNKSKKKASSDKKKTSKELLDTLQSKTKKSKAQNQKRLIPPLQLDATGRPVFPLDLDELTVHSIGEIVTDRSGFHTPKSIYPEGYCSTRVFASTLGSNRKCLYTCKISDGGKGPVFEIASEDSSDLVLRSSSPGDCHNLLITAINKARGENALELVGKGAEFFGLTHPVVQNLVQSCPGSKRCSGYKWVKFEINKATTLESLSLECDRDPAISYKTFVSLVEKKL